MIRRLLFSHGMAILLGLASTSFAADPLFDIQSIRDAKSLEVVVLEDWKPSPKDSSVRQKLIEITVCEWWPGQKVRLPVTLNAPADGKACRNIVVANQPLAKRAATPTGGQLSLLKNYGVGIVLIGMGTIDAMEPPGELHHGMREQLLKTRNPRYSPAWIWGMSQMRALTAAMTEPEVFQPEKVLTTGGSKRGVAAAVAGIHDDRFTAILPVVAPPLGNPGAAAYVMGTEPKRLGEIDEEFYRTSDSGIAKAMRERAQRRADNRVTLTQAEEAGWTKEEIEGMTDRVWNACRITDFLPAVQERGLAFFYNVGTNDSVTPALVSLGEHHPDFPICIIPGGQHGGPATAGFTRRVPTLPEVQDNFLSFARGHFFGDREFPGSPQIESKWDAGTKALSVTVTFPEGVSPEANALWWSKGRSKPYTLPFEYDEWESVEMDSDPKGRLTASIRLETIPEMLDFLTLHTDTENGLPLTVSSAYQRITTK
ncbi:MAG: PhoPQ-activated protein PqaA family protein [Verrucomicrobiales bacterium]|nr:PhoPQ-activated protein PqaA family protein [Verrucomicrobiales bacterium]